jgi:hypothetical protein
MTNAASSSRAGETSLLNQTAVIIPARNEEKSIGLVLEDLPTVARIIVVDNGSTDDTAMIAAGAGCIVVDEPIAGYGRACLAGISKLRILTADTELDIRYVAFVDADYSDHPQELVEMLRVMRDENADFVLGSRMHGKRERRAMPLQAILGNWLACRLMKSIWGANYTDLGPFRVIRYDKLVELDMQDLNFGWTIEMQIKAKRASLRTIEVPVSYRRRIGVSKISGTMSGTVRAGYKILFTIAKYAVRTRNEARKIPPDAHARVRAHEPA